MAPLAPMVNGLRRTLCCHSAALSGKFAPNSLAAVDECVRAGVPRLEVDVRFLADDSMLIFHDSHLAETTTGEGRVDDLDRAAARGLHYRSDLASALCFLEDVVEIMKGSETLLQVDLKLMRPMSEDRLRALSAALQPLGERVLIGSMAHWNLRGLARLGHRVALDPTMQWHFDPDRGKGYFPDEMGVYGMWDDSPIAHNRKFSPFEYFDTRLEDIRGLLPQAEEWMVDIRTILHMAKLSFPLGDELRKRGIALAAWTLTDLGKEDTLDAARRLFEAGAETIITDSPLQLADYLGSVNAL